MACDRLLAEVHRRGASPSLKGLHDNGNIIQKESTTELSTDFVHNKLCNSQSDSFNVDTIACRLSEDNKLSETYAEGPNFATHCNGGCAIQESRSSRSQSSNFVPSGTADDFEYFQRELFEYVIPECIDSVYTLCHTLWSTQFKLMYCADNSR